VSDGPCLRLCELHRSMWLANPYWANTLKMADGSQTLGIYRLSGTLAQPFCTKVAWIWR
jgi:hypothetical protein